MATFRYTTFDELIGLPGVKYIRPRGRVSEPIEIPGITITDVPDDLLILEDAVFYGGARLFWQDRWICDDVHYMPGNWETAPWLPGKYNPEKRELEIDLSPVSERREGVSLFVDTLNGCRFFGHFVHDTLSYVEILMRCQELFGEVDLVAHEFKYSNMRQIFEVIFGKSALECFSQQLPPKNQVDASLRCDLPTRFERLVLARRQANMSSADKPWQLSFAGLRSARSRLLEKGSARTQGSAEDLGGRENRIYVHRKDNVKELIERNNLQGRDYANVHELCGRLLDEGFVGLEPGLVPLNVLLEVLSSADLIVGLHGAGIAHVLFCPQKTVVVEIRSGLGNWRSLEALAAILGNEFRVANQLKSPSGMPNLIDVKSLLQICRP